MKTTKLRTYAQEITNIMLEQELITQDDEYNMIDYLNMTNGGSENA